MRELRNFRIIQIITGLVFVSWFIGCEETTETDKSPRSEKTYANVHRKSDMDAMPKYAPNAPDQEGTPVTIKGFRQGIGADGGIEISWSYEPVDYNEGFAVAVTDSKGIFQKQYHENIHSTTGLQDNTSYYGRAKQVLLFDQAKLQGEHPSAVVEGEPYEVRITANGKNTGSAAFALKMELLSTEALGIASKEGSSGGLATGVANTPTPFNCSYMNGVGGVGANGVGGTSSSGSQVFYDPNRDSPTIVPGTTTPTVTAGNTTVPVTSQSVYQPSQLVLARDYCGRPITNTACGVSPQYCHSSSINSQTAYGCSSCGVPYSPSGSGYGNENEPIPTWGKILLGGTAAAILGYTIYKAFKSDLVEEESVNLVKAEESSDQVDIPYFLLDAGTSGNRRGYIIVTPFKVYKDKNDELFNHSVVPYLKFGIAKGVLDKATEAGDETEEAQKGLDRVSDEISKLKYSYVAEEDQNTNFKNVFSSKVLNFTTVVQEKDESGEQPIYHFYEVARFNIANPYWNKIKASSATEVFKDTQKGIKQFYRFFSDSIWPDQSAKRSEFDQFPKFDIIVSETVVEGKSTVKAFLNCLGYVCSSSVNK